MWATLTLNYPHYFTKHYFEVAHYNLMCDKLVWVFLPAYLDEISRPYMYHKIINVNKGMYNKINVVRTKFQPI